MKSNIATAVLLGSLSLSQAVHFAYSPGQQDRDAEAGYPTLPVVEDNQKFVSDYIEKSSGRFLTPYEVSLAKARA